MLHTRFFVNLELFVFNIAQVSYYRQAGLWSIWFPKNQWGLLKVDSEVKFYVIVINVHSHKEEFGRNRRGEPCQIVGFVWRQKSQVWCWTLSPAPQVMSEPRPLSPVPSSHLIKCLRFIFISSVSIFLLLLPSVVLFTRCSQILRNY